MNRNPTSAHRHRKRGKNIIMWGLILSVVVFLALGLRECPSLDPRENMARAANVPIEMWIELRDQHDVPLRNHPVTVSLWHWHNDSQEEAELRNTDADGRLYVVGRRHCGVTLTLDKDIYQETHMMPWWFTSTLVTGVRREMIRDDWGTAEQPTICRVLRKEGPQPLTEVWGKVYFPFRPGPIGINMRDGIVTADSNEADLVLTIDLGDEVIRESDFDVIDKTPRHPPGALFYPKRTMRLRAVKGWIEPLPRDSHWYTKYVHAALPYKASDEMAPQIVGGTPYGGFSEDYFFFGSRDGTLHGKGVISMNPGNGPGKDPVIVIRALINPTGSKSFEHTVGTVAIKEMGLDANMAPEGYVPNRGFDSSVTWDGIHPQASFVPRSSR